MKLSEPHMFNPQVADEQKFLGFLASVLSEAELMSLEFLEGFSVFETCPFPYERFLEPIKRRRFPRQEYYEIQVGIYECGLDSFESCPRALQMYVSSLYIYCNKAKLWGLYLESDFLYREIRREMIFGPSEFSNHFLRFLEWAYVYGPVDTGYDDYYFLLSWLMLSRLAGAGASPLSGQVLNYLHKKELTADDIEVLSTSEFKSTDWLALHQTIPLPDKSQSSIFEQVISGVHE